MILRMALSDAGEALDLWRDNPEVLTVRPHPVETRFILPLLYRNTGKFHSELTPDFLQYLRLLYLTTYGENIKRLKTFLTLAKQFKRAGLNPTLLKGGALLLHYYESPPLRPMADLDIYIPEKEKDAAVRLLYSLGWKHKPGGNAAFSRSHLKWQHAYPFYNGDGQWVDLHWHILHECCYEEANEILGRAMVDCRYKGVDYTVLGHADQLLHTFVQGARCEGVVSLRWAADAVYVIKHAGNAIDWNRLVYLSDKFRLVRPVRDAVLFLKHELGVAIPETALLQLQGLRVSRCEDFEYRYKRARVDNRLLSYWPVLWFDYSRRMQGVSMSGKIAGFPQYIKEYWSIKRFTEFAGLFKAMLTSMYRSYRR